MFSPKRSRWHPHLFYISDITNSLSFNGTIFRKKSMLENFRANVLKLSLLLKVSFEDNLEQPRTVRAFYLFSSLLIDYMRVALIWLLENKALRCLVVLNCLNASFSAKQHPQNNWSAGPLARDTIWFRIPFIFFSILASSLILSLFFEVIQRQINVCLHFAVIYNLYSDFIVLVFFLHVTDLLYF